LIPIFGRAVASASSTLSKAPGSSKATVSDATVACERNRKPGGSSVGCTRTLKDMGGSFILKAGDHTILLKMICASAGHEIKTSNHLGISSTAIFACIRY
jgi:hypothetical protein